MCVWLALQLQTLNRGLLARVASVSAWGVVPVSPRVRPQRKPNMRRALVLVIAVALTLGIGFSASAKPLNIEGTVSTQIGSDLPPLDNTLGGVATVNNSAGAIPSHLQTLQLKGS